MLNDYKIEITNLKLSLSSSLSLSGRELKVLPQCLEWFFKVSNQTLKEIHLQHLKPPIFMSFYEFFTTPLNSFSSSLISLKLT